MMCAYRDPAFDLIVGAPSAWTSPRLPDLSGLAAGYASAGGVPLVDWEFHLALACFKVGVIAAGIDHRHRAGAGSGAGFDTAGESVAAYFSTEGCRRSPVGSRTDPLSDAGTVVMTGRL